MTVRRTGRDWLIVLVNESGTYQMGVEVGGLEDLNGMDFVLLYEDETVRVNNGGFITRMKPHDVKVFTTSRRWENGSREGREYGKDED